MNIVPSIEMIPAKYSAGILLCQEPMDGSGDFSVTRATNVANRFNAAGFIETVTSGLPRLDYYTSGGTAGCPALLVEPSAQNVVVQSQNWLASGWRSDATANVTTVSATTGTIDPLGTNTANATSPTSGSAIHLKVGSENSASFTNGTIYTESAFFKQGTGNAGRYVQLTYPAARFSQNGFANFDLQAGAVVASGGTADTNRAARIENYGNDWYRCSFTATCTSNGTENGFTAILITASGSTRALPFSGTTSDVLYGWGAQTEIGSIATSYIPTTTTSGTRNAEVITLSGAVSGCIGQTEGTMYAEVDVRALSVAKSIFGVSLNSNTTDFANIQINSSNRILARIRSNTGTLQDITASSTVTGTTKIAMAYDSSGSILVVNGTIIGTNASGIASWSSGVNFVHIGNGPSAASGSSQGAFFNDRIRAAALYTTRLTNPELAALTTL